MGTSGLESLIFGEHEFLRSGRMSIETIDLRRLDGTRIETATNPRATRIDASGGAAVYSYDWGTLTARYISQTDRLEVVIEVENQSDYVIHGLRLRLFELVAPDPSASKIRWMPKTKANLEGPDAVVLSYTDGHFVLANDEISRFLLLNLVDEESRGTDRALAVALATAIRGRHLGPTGEVSRVIYPKQVDRFLLSMRFVPMKASLEDALSPVYSRFAQSFPAQLRWPDRRPIGALFLSSSERTSRTNPRGWFNSPELNFVSSVAHSDFQSRLLSYAEQSISVLKRTGAQGMIVWDIEGQEYRHPISYLGNPLSLPPEMEAIVDGFFRRFTDAGLRCGVTIRPQAAVRPVYGSAASQLVLADAVDQLKEKIRYVRQRWGCTLFYVDSNGDPNWPIDALIFREAAAANPDVLLIPEHKTMLYYGYTAPYCELRQGCTSTQEEVRKIYPYAFTVINVADGDLRENWSSLVHAVQYGDVLLFRAWFEDPANAEVRKLYAAAQ